MLQRGTELVVDEERRQRNDNDGGDANLASCKADGDETGGAVERVLTSTG